MEIRPFHRSNSKLEMLSSTIKSTHNICMNFWELFKWKVLHIYNFFCFPTVVWQLIDMIDEIYFKRIEHKNGYHLKTLRNRTCLTTIISEHNSQFWFTVARLLMQHHFRSLIVLKSALFLVALKKTVQWELFTYFW